MRSRSIDHSEGDGVRGDATIEWPGVVRPMLEWHTETPTSRRRGLAGGTSATEDAHHGTDVDGVLVLYHFIPPYAETVLEHALAFERHSRFPVWSLNTAERFPSALDDLRFRVVVLHYSLFGSADYRLDAVIPGHTCGRRGDLRVAFFQDEYQHCAQRFAFIDDFARGLGLHPAPPRGGGGRVRGADPRPAAGHHHPGPRGIGHAPRGEQRRPAGGRTHRSTSATGPGPCPSSPGAGDGRRARSAAGSPRWRSDRGLALDIATDEADRLYGDAWYAFLGSCRAVLGVEAGVSIFDLDDQVRPATEAFLASHPSATFEEVERAVLAPWEDNVFYRTISPRHFEAAAFGTCQILFEGSYSGLMEAGTHYIGLRKDFGNLDEVIATFRDRVARARIVANARRDLIDSGRHTYQVFVDQFDDELVEPGSLLRPGRGHGTWTGRWGEARRCAGPNGGCGRPTGGFASPPAGRPGAADGGTSPGTPRSSAGATTPDARGTTPRWRPAPRRTDARAASRGPAAAPSPPRIVGRGRADPRRARPTRRACPVSSRMRRASSRFSSSNPLPML